MKTTNYYNTFIEVADDCPAQAGTVPPVKKVKTVAQYQYEVLVDNPYRFTSDEVFAHGSYAKKSDYRGSTGAGADRVLLEGSTVFSGVSTDQDVRVGSPL